VTDDLTPQVTPALTPEEWGATGYSRDGIGAASVERGHVTVHDWRVDGPFGEEIVGLAPPECHAVAALCLHNQPFGFTQDDVELINEAAGFHDSLTYHSFPEEAVKYRALASRIAALLPPPTPDGS
jgi:hypothetical protein